MPFVITQIKEPCHVIDQIVVTKQHAIHRHVRKMHKPQEVHVSRLPRVGRVVVTFRDPSGVVHTRAFNQVAATMRYVVPIVQEYRLFQIKPDLYIGAGRKYPSFLTLNSAKTEK